MPIFGFMGFAAPQPTTVPASNPAISSLSTVNWKEGATGVEINGTDFGLVGASVEVSRQGIGQSTTIGIAQTKTAQTDTKLTVTVVIPTVGGVKRAGYYKVQVTHNGGAKSNTVQVLIGPNQTVVGTEHASGLVLIDFAVDTIQTIIDAEAAGTSFHSTGIAQNKTFQLRANDQLVAVGTCEMRGDKEITDGVGGHSWATSGSNWEEANQTQADVASGSATDTWHQDNTNNAGFYVILSTQDHRRACNLRRYGDATALSAAFTSDSLGSTPIESHFNNDVFKDDEFWITVAISPVLHRGEAVLVEGADAQGGVTLDGFYEVIQAELGRVLIQHEAPATSAGTGGGSSVVLKHGLGCWFDATLNTVQVNFDPTVSTYRFYASITDTAVDAVAENTIILGQDIDNKFKIYRFSARFNTGTVKLSLGTSRDNGWYEHLEVSRNSGHGLGINESDHKILECDFFYNGQSGHGGGKSDFRANNFSTKQTFRRCRVWYNGHQNYGNDVSAGSKTVLCDTIDMDQMSYLGNRAQGLWFDIRWSLAGGGGVRRIDAQRNGRKGIFAELTTLGDHGAGDSKIFNSIMRDNGDDHSHFQISPAGFLALDVFGDATHRLIFEQNLIQCYDHPDLGAGNGIKMAVDTRPEKTAFIINRDNLIVYRSASGGSGFQAQGGAADADVDVMQDTCEFNNNKYRTPAVDNSKDVFHHNLNPGTVSTFLTLAEWRALATPQDTAASGSTVTYNVSDQLCNWPPGKIPDWGDDEARSQVT